MCKKIFENSIFHFLKMDKKKCPILKNGLKNFHKKYAILVLEHNALFLSFLKIICYDKLFYFFEKFLFGIFFLFLRLSKN